MCTHTPYWLFVEYDGTSRPPHSHRALLMVHHRGMRPLLTCGEEPFSTALVSRYGYMKSATYRLSWAPVLPSFPYIPIYAVRQKISQPMMYAAQRCPSIPLCDHSRPHFDRTSGTCSAPWPTLPHRACHPRQAVSAGATVRRSRSTRERSRSRSRESFSTVAFPRHVASRRHLSHSAISVRAPKPMSSPDPKNHVGVKPPQTPPLGRLQDHVLPRLREEPSHTSIKVNYDEDEHERLSECDTGFDSFVGDDSPIPLPSSQSSVPSRRLSFFAPKPRENGSPAGRASERQMKTRSMPPTSMIIDSPTLPSNRHDRTIRTRSMFVFANSNDARQPRRLVSESSSSSPSQQSSSASPISEKAKLQPSPTFTRTRAVRSGLRDANASQPRLPTVTSPTLRLFPNAHPSSPTGSIDSTRSASTCGGSTITSTTNVNIFNLYQQSSCFEDDDDEEKKGLMEYLTFNKRSEKVKADAKKPSVWKRLFCCFSGASDQ